LYSTDRIWVSNGHPQVAQVAIQQGINLAENFANECQQIIKTFIIMIKDRSIIGKK
jgi:NADH dehydrogenase FAD-containing subunit